MAGKDEKHGYQWKNDGWWVDYMEGELRPAVKESLDLLLTHSKTDRLILENYELLRSLVGMTDELAVQVQAADMEKIHQKIMSRLDEPLDPEPLEEKEEAVTFIRRPSAT